MKFKNSLLFIACSLFLFQLVAAEDVGQSGSAGGNDGTFQGTVVEITNVSTYTYVCVETKDKKVWAATTHFPVKVGDSVVVLGGIPMPNYHSQTMNRDFDVVYFTGKILVGNGSDITASLPPFHPSIIAPSPAQSVNVSGIKPAEGGKTIKDIYAASTSLAGKTVTVRGKVVKSNVHILGKNWLHIQDGTGTVADRNNDLTVTTTANAAVGDTVLITGTVSTNQDFGAGYRFGVIIVDAKVKVE